MITPDTTTERSVSDRMRDVDEALATALRFWFAYRRMTCGTPIAR